MESVEVAVGNRKFEVIWFVSERRSHCVIAEESKGTLFLGEVCRTTEDKHDPQIAMKESARKACAQVKGIKAWLFHEIRLHLHRKFTADGWRRPITERDFSRTYFPTYTTYADAEDTVIDTPHLRVSYDDVEDTTRILR